MQGKFSAIYELTSLAQQTHSDTSSYLGSLFRSLNQLDLSHALFESWTFKIFDILMLICLWVYLMMHIDIILYDRCHNCVHLVEVRLCSITQHLNYSRRIEADICIPKLVLPMVNEQLIKCIWRKLLHGWLGKKRNKRMIHSSHLSTSMGNFLRLFSETLNGIYNQYSKRSRLSTISQIGHK